MTHQQCVVYLPRDYPSLSQTFIRNEVHGLRSAGMDVEVLALRWSLADQIAEGWGGAHRVAAREPWSRSLKDSLYWATRHPLRYARMWRHVVAAPRGMRWTAVRLLPTFARDVAGRHPLACHTHFAFDHAWATLYVSALLGVPATITVHAADIYVDTDSAVSLLNRFDAVVNVCRYNEAFLRDHGLSGPRLHVVSCGVDLPRATEVNSNPKGPELVSVGRMVPKKGFPGLLRAMALVLQQVPEARLTIIGGGELYDEVADLIRSLGLDGRVVLEGARPHAEALRSIGEARAFVLNCAVPPDGNTDAVPVVLREAMARAVPVVTTDVAGVPEAVDDSCGWVVAAGDDRALAAALIESLRDPETAKAKGAVGRKRIAEGFTIDASAERMTAIFASWRK